MMIRLPQNIVEELKALSTDQLHMILDFNRVLRDTTGLRSALDPAIESLLGEREALDRKPLRRLLLQSVSRLTPIPQS
jgi:hypothetical protein